MKRRFLYLVLAVFLLLTFNFSQEREDLKAVLEDIDKVGGSEKYPDANLVTIFENYKVRFEESGEFKAKEHTLVKILTDKGKRDYAVRKFPYHKRYSEVEVLLARVIKKNGEVLNVPKDMIKDGTVEEVQMMNIFEENFRRVSVTFPSLEVGDSIETIVEIRSRPLIKGHYNDIILFQGFEPILRKEVEIDGPSSKPLRFVVKNGVLDFKKERKGNRIIYKWGKTNSPKIIPELGMVPITDVATKLLVSSFKNWKELSRYGESLNVGKIDSNEKMREKVIELTKDLKTEEEKILAIFRFISQKIRYMGSSMDLGAFIEPHPATYTFEKQYGVCRDKSILMMAMLKEIGINSYDALINVSQNLEKEIPVIFLEHAICAVVLKDGRMVFMDPTLELSPSFGETYVGGRYVLLLDKKGKDLVKVPNVPAGRSLGYIRSDTRVNSDGSIEGRVKISGKNFYEYVLRSLGKQIPSFQFTMLWQQLSQFISPGTKVENLKSGDFADLSKPFEINFDFKTKDYVVDTGKFRLFRIPLSSCSFDVLLIGILRGLTNLDERKYPMNFTSSFGTIIEERLIIPDEFLIKAIPDPVEIKKLPVNLKIETSRSDKKVIFKLDFRIEKANISPAEYRNLREVANAIKMFQKSMVILEKKGVQSEKN
ncbi:MAG: DUF3857 domain-containing transglutaminase family protein [Candidatus Aminicenantia bacterium]